MHLPNHLMLGSTLATVPGATVDWNCKGLTTFPRSLLGTEDQRQCEHSTYCYIPPPLTRTAPNQQLTRINQIKIIISYHLCFCLYIFRRLIVARSLMLFPPAPLARSVKNTHRCSTTHTWFENTFALWNIKAASTDILWPSNSKSCFQTWKSKHFH